MNKEELLKWATSKNFEMCIWDDEIIVSDGKHHYVSLDIAEVVDFPFKKITRMIEKEMNNLRK